MAREGLSCEKDQARATDQNLITYLVLLNLIIFLLHPF